MANSTSQVDVWIAFVMGIVIKNYNAILFYTECFLYILNAHGHFQCNNNILFFM